MPIWIPIFSPRHRQQVRARWRNSEIRHGTIATSRIPASETWESHKRRRWVRYRSDAAQPRVRWDLVKWEEVKVETTHQTCRRNSDQRACRLSSASSLKEKGRCLHHHPLSILRSNLWGLDMSKESLEATRSWITLWRSQTTQEWPYQRSVQASQAT